MNGFNEFLHAGIERGGFTTEDTLASFLPLLRQVVSAHAEGETAPLQGVESLQVETGILWYEEALRKPPTLNWDDVRRLEPDPFAMLEVVSEARRTTNVDDDDEVQNLLVGDGEQPVTKLVYLPRYSSWEQAIGHHDPISDVFSLGMILASIACGIDLNDRTNLERFVECRGNLFRLNPSLHPVLARAITRMTELDRLGRPQDLQPVLKSLENYRDQDVDLEIDLAQIEGFETGDRKSKQQIILSKLQERLFEISRRNRLLHFKSTMQTLDLTQASVPLAFDVSNLRAEQILSWSGAFRKSVLSGKAFSLNKHLNFEEALYLPSTLDRIRTESQRDKAEYGFEQLRLVLCFLRWTNLKESPVEFYESPLVLLPVTLTKKKGIRDTHWLRPIADEAEVNPVVRYQFKQLYDIDLPETVPLTEESLDELHALLVAKIATSGQSVHLEKIDKPRIELTHDRARRRLDQYRRKARVAGKGIRSFLDNDYSYDPANYHPLGIKLFNSLVRPLTTHLREIIQNKPRPRNFAVPDKQPPVVETEKSFFHLKQSEEGNPYSWEFDLCGVTLGNFKYRKMSLVRDYARLVEEDMPNEAFDATFSLQPRNPDQPAIELPPLEERFYVVPCDPTQAESIAQAQTGESYIIQGPPGTGKSQTITNLIADFVARGKRVLFVCEKRAAIDVVYLRLKQQGLDDLCSLIHDSQADKKSFVMDLKATYEGLLKDDGSQDADKQRQQQITAVERELQPLEAFHQAMREKTENAGIPIRQLLQRVVELNQKPQLTDLEKERLPHFALWNQHRESIERFDGALREVQSDGVLSQHPLRRLQTKLAADERPLERISTNLDRATQLLEQLSQLTDGELTDSIWQPIQRAIETVALARKLEFLAENRLCKLLDHSSPPAGQFASDTRERQSQADALSRAEEKTNAWREKLPSAEVGPALSQAQQMEGSLLRWLQPAWWRLRGIVLKRYDFSTHVVKPTISHVLTELAAEHDAVQKLNTIDDRLRQQYAFSGDVHQFVERVAQASEELKSDETGLGETLLALGTPDQIVLNLIAAGKSLDQLCGHLDAFMQDYDQHNWEALRDDLQSIDDSLDGLTDFLICLSELAGLPANISEALRNLPLNATTIEAAVADRTLQQAFRSTRAIERYDGATRRRTVERLEKHYDAWQKGNAVAVRQVVQNRFREHMRITTLTAAEMTGEQKEFKKHYNKGRRELEHEFGKSMRYKSIRDLVAEDSGLVVRDLKPVWLMSPLSVSDTLPLSPDEFDVVIFDEASQITLEEAIPSLFRARQAIVVGDQMQLPPTNFFSAKRAEDDEQLIFEEEDEQVEYDLDSDSFLNHAARNLSSTMLGWHYRSRSESLISFSNWAFYQGRLLTVPEERLAEESVSELRVTSAIDGEHGAHELLRRPVSFHRLDHGVYENRRNRSEAEYIAQMVRTLLLEDSGVSIGIVAFSEAQQGTIEDALARLAREDEPFADALEAEWEREQDGEFCGLLVKNLENIQGDERDVIIMSVCYGRDPQGKMRMNFGPINKSGGEKRLNVAFSRARHHMALVSSIQASEITNDYNTGANCLKNYINYAAAVSIGKMDVAQRILRDMTLTGEADSHKTATQNDAVCDQLEFELKQRGLIVDRGVGQSHFRCDLAIRREEDRSYRLGILVDTEEFYSEENLIETEMMRPRLLRNFGWTLTHVLAKDWHEDREEVLQRLIESL